MDREPALWQAVGNTPLLPVTFPEIATGRLWLKAEWLNPGGSVKDRAARAILRDAHPARRAPGPASARRVERQHRDRVRDAGGRGRNRRDHLPSGQRKPGAPSAARDLWCRGDRRPIVSTERRGRRVRARELAEAEPDRYFYADQYGNPANPQAHRETTGPEIWTQTGGRHHPFRRRNGDDGNHDGHRRVPEGEESRRHAGGRAARWAVPWPRGAEASAHHVGAAGLVRSVGPRSSGRGRHGDRG